jgi:hypothetical protein
MRRPQLRSNFARAVVPVLAGIGFFLIVGLLLWGVAALSAGNSDKTTANLAPAFQEMGNAEWVAGRIADGGPIILQDLIGSDRNIVLDHTDADGFFIYLAHPADRDATCQIVQVKRSSPTATAARSSPRTWHHPRRACDRSSTTTAR